MTLLIMGVAGSGKTTVGKQVARKLAFEFIDGDDFQPSENVEKIRGGQALSDAADMLGSVGSKAESLSAPVEEIV